MPPSFFKKSVIVFVASAACVLCASLAAQAQREHVAVDNPVYDFLKTMEVRGLIREYHHAILPLSRLEVAKFLKLIDAKRDQLSPAEREYLDDFFIEFQYELGTPKPAPNVFLDFDLPVGENFVDAFAWKRKSLYEYHDSNATIFVDGLASADYRKRGGDSSQNVSLLSLGGRVHGTVHGDFGYSVVAINGSLNSGSLALAEQDPRLASNYKLADAEHKNFDFTEGYAVYDNNFLTIEVGRESMRIGAGYLDRMVLADHAPPMDLIRLGLQYKSLKYIFLHGSLVQFGLNDSTGVRNHLDIIPKYMAMHRVEFDLLDKARFGFSEMVVYGNQFAQLAYLNPFSFIKSAENSLESNDNTLMDFDAEVHAMDNVSLFGELLIDDFSLTTRGTGARNNKLGYHGGVFYTNPLGISNVNVVLEYQKLTPYVYSHRTDWNTYTNRDISLGSNLAPNSDLLSLQVQWRPRHNLGLTGTISYMRHGGNTYDSLGLLAPLGNVGGSVLDDERNPDDPALFLKGILTTEFSVGGKISYEPFKQWTFAVEGNLINRVTAGVAATDVYLGLHAAVDY